MLCSFREGDGGGAANSLSILLGIGLWEDMRENEDLENIKSVADQVNGACLTETWLRCPRIRILAYYLRLGNFEDVRSSIKFCSQSSSSHEDHCNNLQIIELISFYDC
jgi:hypothetical protein